MSGMTTSRKPPQMRWGGKKQGTCPEETLQRCGWRKAEQTCHVLHQEVTAFIERAGVRGRRADELWGAQALSCAYPSQLQLRFQPAEHRLDKSTRQSWPGIKEGLLKPNNFHLWSFPLGQEMLKSYKEKTNPNIKVRSRRGYGSN